jgi:pimeloyl-ACP methyl ester carboxylesterase
MSAPTDSDIQTMIERPQMPGTPQFFESRTLSLDFQLTRGFEAMIVGAGEQGECWSTARRIQEGDRSSWVEAWLGTADRIHQMGQESLESGHPVSAAECFLRCMTYYRLAEFFLSADDPRKREVYMRGRTCFQQFCRLSTPAIEILQIPYQGTWLPGYFAAAGSGQPCPTMLILSGWDGTCEELYLGVPAALRRGYNALIFEVPGQIGTVHLHPELKMRHDTEVPVGAVIDYALTRPDVDPERLALSGFSMGGYFAPRAAAFDGRIKALIADPPNPEMRRLIIMALGLLDRIFQEEPIEDADDLVEWDDPVVQWFYNEARHRVGVSSLAEFLEALRPYNLWGLEHKIACPTLALCGESELGAVEIFGKPWFDDLDCSKDLHVFTVEEGAEMHCQLNNISRLYQVMFDWLDDVFGHAS